MNWYKRLNSAWKDFYAKKKNDGRHILPCIKSFSDNYKVRLAVIERHLQRRDYNFGKWRATLIPKKDGGNRPLIIPTTIRDKLVLKAISEYISDSLSDVFSDVSSISYAYQKGKSTRDALIQLKRIHKAENVLLKIDIKHFFDEVDKTILIQLLEQYPIDDYVKSLICKSIHHIVDYSSLKKSDIDKFPSGGIPQGNPISAVLSNLYLYELDRFAISKGWKMVRYADDMVFSVYSHEEALIILSQIDKYLLETRKLAIHSLKSSSDAKTAIFLNPRKNSMKYLGVIFDGQNLYPTKECCEHLIKRVKTTLKCTSTSKEKEMAIKKAITQWCGYYAFTDIPNSKIKRINNAINYQISKHKLDVAKINIAKVLLRTRKRQNNRFFKIFNPLQIREEHRWLNIYG